MPERPNFNLDKILELKKRADRGEFHVDKKLTVSVAAVGLAAGVMIFMIRQISFAVTLNHIHPI